MNEQQELIIEKIAVLSTRLDAQEKDIKTLYKKCEELSHSTNTSDINNQKIFVMIENLSSQMNEMNVTLKELSSKPSKNWDNIIRTIITALVGGLVAFCLFKLGLK